MNIVDPSEYPNTTSFAHLHLHTISSALDGVGTLDQYAEACIQRQWSGMAVTEHGHMASVPEFYLTFNQKKLKPIFGCEIYFNDYEPVRQKLERQGIKYRTTEWRKDNPELAARISRNRHLTVLCKNEIGYRNLIKLTTQAYKTGLFGMGRMQFNRVWFDKLCEFKEGLIVLSGCLNGPVSHELRYRAVTDREGNIVNDRDLKTCLIEAVSYIKKFKKAFGEDYYIELQMPGIPEEGPFPSDVVVFHQLLQLADHYKIKTVLTNDTHYLQREDFILQKIMMAVAQDTTIDSPDLFHVNSDEQYMKTRPELWSRFKNEYSAGIDDGAFELMCDSTLEIMDKCEHITIDTSPKIPEIQNADDKLRQIVAREMKSRGLHKISRKFIVDGKEVTYLEQAKIELNRFIDKGFASYFLITQDLVQYGRSQGWNFNPRGSAGGSLVCYLLGITNIDPLKWKLSFDRFLSPSRGGYMLDLSMGSE